LAFSQEPSKDSLTLKDNFSFQRFKFVLAVVTPDPNIPAETYVRQHIRDIAPGRTAVIYFQGEGIDFGAIPNLKLPFHQRQNWPLILRKTSSFWSLIVHGYSGILDKSQKTRLIKFFSENKVKIVLAEFGPVGCAIKDACREAGVSLFVHFHGQDATVLPRRWLYRHAYRRLGREASGIICHSRYLADKISTIGLPEEKIHVIPYGINVHEFKPCENRDLNLILAVGRFVEKKAPHLTIKAFARVQKRIPQVRLEMIGNGPLLSRCKNTVSELEISNNIIFHGAREHNFVKERLQKACVFVQHSVTAPNGDTESLGISLLEAMAAGVPVVATRHNGFVETVKDGETGYLVDEYDVKGMAKRVIQLLNNQKLRNEMGKTGRQLIIDKFSTNQQLENLRNILLTIG
jgi:glycosyltransferase involved in cell wall biosynthesis